MALKQGLYSLSCTCCKTSYLKISRVSWTLEAARLCLNILQLSTFKYDRRGLAALLLATCQISKWLGNSKYQSHTFSDWLKITATLRYCWFIVISDRILYEPPKGCTDHPAIHHGWSVGRPRICDFEWMNIYFTEVFRLVHHFTCIYTSSWISHTSDSHKSFNIYIYISFVLPAVCASFIQGLYFWFRVFKVIIPVYQYITKFFLRFSTLATGTLRSWSVRHQFDACASRWCPTDANPSVPMVRAISTFSFVLKEEMKTSVGIPEEVALSSWSPYICYDFYFSYWFC